MEANRDVLLRGLLAINVKAMRDTEQAMARFKRRLGHIVQLMDDASNAEQSKDAFISFTSVTKQLEAAQNRRQKHFFFITVICRWFKARGEEDSSLRDVVGEYWSVRDHQMPTDLIPRDVAVSWAQSVTRCLARMDASERDLAMPQHLAVFAGLSELADSVSRERVSCLKLIESISKWLAG